MKPMLAHKFVDHRNRLQYPIYVQPKLDGVRGLYSRGQFQSRDEHLYRPAVVAQFTRELELMNLHEDFILDGEFYFHGLKLQRINSAIGVNRLEPSEQTARIEYHIFDVIHKLDPLQPFSERAKLLDKIREKILYFNCSRIRVVPTHFVDELTAEALYCQYRSNGYEGTMYRIPSAPYGFAERCPRKDNRWSCLLKRKEWQDDFFPVVGWEEGEGKYQGQVGALVCRTANGATFTVGSGISDEERTTFLYKLPSQAKVRFEAYSEAGVPLKPTLESTHE